MAAVSDRHELMQGLGPQVDRQWAGSQATTSCSTSSPACRTCPCPPPPVCNPSLHPPWTRRSVGSQGSNPLFATNPEDMLGSAPSTPPTEGLSLRQPGPFTGTPPPPPPSA